MTASSVAVIISIIHPFLQPAARWALHRAQRPDRENKQGEKRAEAEGSGGHKQRWEKGGREGGRELGRGRRIIARSGNKNGRRRERKMDFGLWPFAFDRIAGQTEPRLSFVFFAGLFFHVVGEGVVNLARKAENVTDKENYIDFRLRLLGEPGKHKDSGYESLVIIT